jgi:hypothetical protein
MSKSRGQVSNLLLGGGIVVLLMFGITLLAIVGGFVKLQPQTPAPIVATGGQQVSVDTSGQAQVSFACASDLTNDVYTSVKNGLNPNTEYLGNSLVASFSNKKGEAATETGTATSGTSKSDVKVSIPCATSGTMYALASSTYIGAEAPFDVTAGDDRVLLSAANASRVNVVIRNSALTNDTAGVLNDQTQPISNTVTMGAGSVYDFYLDVSANGTATQFGGTQGGIIVAANIPTAKFDQNSGISLSGDAGYALTRMSECPSEYANYQNAKACWSGAAIKSTDGIVRLKGRLQATNNPATSDDVTIWINAKDVISDTDNVVKTRSFDSAGTQKTTSPSNVTIDVS